MNGKYYGETGAFSSDGMRAEILNPFVHKLELDNTFDKIKIFYGTNTGRLAIRYSADCDIHRDTPTLPRDRHLLPDIIQSFRCFSSKLRSSILSLTKLVIFAAGFHRVKILGKQNTPANPRDAPVLVMAPHSSFFDAISIVWLGGPSVVAKADTARLPFIGRMALKPLICFIGKMSYLAGGMAISIRGRQASRKEAPILVVAPHSSFLDSCIVYATKMSSVIVRKESMDNYILIFPEGTCTNRSCLITFKSGGFYPGVPVQPVTIRYPNAKDTVETPLVDADTGAQLVRDRVPSRVLPERGGEERPKAVRAERSRCYGKLKLLWLTLTQVHSSCEIEFLPVYYPSDGEKSDPKLEFDFKLLWLTPTQVHSSCEIEFLPVYYPSDGEKSDPKLEFDFKLLWLTLTQVHSSCEIDFLPVYYPSDEEKSDPKLYARNRSSGLAFFPDYLLCAAFLSLQHAPLSQLLSYAFKSMDTCDGASDFTKTRHYQQIMLCL
ncbi:Lysophosphatidylcholine acyltransferase 2 [Operophtera brumata]|uniref:Lysophosphatidylcholine acyltransferase 2 n=1 Tax=Operophtera brumata TaxID=104452 RepID=A0A0L7LNR1_OPEBR|nr:Lysophosphatidylcholine acyltransferase 2 [Operophtera brumata]